MNTLPRPPAVANNLPITRSIARGDHGSPWHQDPGRLSLPVPATAIQARYTVKEPATARAALAEDKAKGKFYEAEEEGVYLYHKAKDVILRPHVAGGLIVVNLSIIGASGYLLYTDPRYRRDARALGAAVVGSLALFGAEGALAESYLQTPEGQADKRRVLSEGLYL
ncbi:hypothetical protein PENSPDRAFT_758196 [Peniophora sp. CONT]|nr:hypothetical protein PENSPDRAFT_758196 [Peniophora sp. CONT]